MYEYHVALCIMALYTALLGYHYRNTLPSHVFMKQVSNSSIALFLKELTLEPHVAGTPEDFATAKYVHDKFTEFGLSTRYVDYEVLLSYPLNRSLSVVYPNGSSLELSLHEEAVEGDSYTNNSKVVPTYLAYAPSGTVTAEVVYANYGQKEDFKKLTEMGVDVNGSVVLARYGRSFRGDIVFNAQEQGAVAVVVFSDPQEYAANGTQGYYPFSKWLPPSGVQRGSLLQDPGDPLTPGWPSTADAERVDYISDPSSVGLPLIPALPISAQDALPIIAALEGDVAPAGWQGGLPVDSYRVGKGPVKLDLRYLENQTVSKIRNVIGTIEGIEKDRYVLLGNHRDAWTFGATDPNSGTACLLEIARIFGKYLRRPARTIVFCSWDAEEYSLTGSTEWVEDNLDLLSARAVAYLNVDQAVGGSSFRAAATPQLDDLLFDITKMVKDPDSSGTVFSSWCRDSLDNCVRRLGGGGSDYAPFLQHAGIPSVNMEYEDSGYPVYHSLYDNFNWMKEFGDPEFKHHTTVAKIWGLTAKRLATDKVLPFKYVSYAETLDAAVKELEGKLLIISDQLDDSQLVTSKSQLQELTFGPLYAALKELRASAAETVSSKYSLRSINDRLLLAERSFLDAQGLPGKPWFKHLIYGPTQSNVYGTETFPAVVDAISKLSSAAEKKNNREELNVLKRELQHEIWRASRVIARAAKVLKGDLT